jgi:hypothetical protein
MKCLLVFFTLVIQLFQALAQNVLHAESELQINQKYYSSNKKYFVKFQSDGNLVVYVASPAKEVPLWSSETSGKASTKCLMQGDGNLVIYNRQTPIWDSKSCCHSHIRSPLLEMQNDGNLVIYAQRGKFKVPLWSYRSGPWTQAQIDSFGIPPRKNRQDPPISQPTPVNSLRVYIFQGSGMLNICEKTGFNYYLKNTTSHRYRVVIKITDKTAPETSTQGTYVLNANETKYIGCSRVHDYHGNFDRTYHIISILKL